MKQLIATITSIQFLTSNLHLLTLTAPDLPHLRAGQVVLTRVNDSFDPYLRRAYFAIPSPTEPHLCSILVDRRDDSASRLYNISDTLDLIAPVGNGFALDASTRRLLLIGDEAHLAPLIALAHEATQKQIAVTLLVERDGRDDAARRDDSPSRLYELLLPLDVEYQFEANIATITPDLLRWPDQICAAGSPAMIAQLRARITQIMPVVPSGFAQVIVAPPMACGFGACLACAVETTRGVRLACVDGSVFDLMELM